ncbi:hypothetical protein D3C85_1217630 [compost metagenome]
MASLQERTKLVARSLLNLLMYMSTTQFKCFDLCAYERLIAFAAGLARPEISVRSLMTGFGRLPVTSA